MTKAQAKKYYKNLLGVDDATAGRLADEYAELVRKEKEA